MENKNNGKVNRRLCCLEMSSSSLSSSSLSSIPVGSTKKNGVVVVVASKKAWKASFREACLVRARRRRQQQQQQQRQRQQQQRISSRHQEAVVGMLMNETIEEEGEEDDGDNNILFDQHHDVDLNSIERTIHHDHDNKGARYLVEEEMRLHGISIMSTPCKSDIPGSAAITPDSLYNKHHSMLVHHPDHDSRSGNASVHQENWNESHQQNAHPTSNHYITEEELYELLEEVENEIILNHDDDLLEEMIDNALLHEKRDIDDQIAEFERWQEQESKRWEGDGEYDSNQDEGTNNEFVLCPICNEASLVLGSADGRRVTCPNHMDGSCPFELELGQQGSTMCWTLQDLKLCLGRAHEQHAMSSCQSGRLFFEIMEQQPQQQQPYDSNRSATLVAVCGTCGMREAVL